MAFFEGKKMTGGYGGPDIITSCTVDVNRGEIVAILGPNGAGKSTAMKAMLGLINLKSGTVTIDGKDISNLSPQDRVKQGISFVPQTRNVFTGLSVKENLEMGAFLRKEDLEKVIEEIYELFPILKEKQSQLVGELSGGQRQRVAIARTLLTNSPILIFDDSTSSVDAGTDARIRLALKELTRGQTTLIIAHRLSSLRHAEEIIVLDNGEVAERGTHDQLVELGGRYSELWDLQRGDMGVVEE